MNPINTFMCACGWFFVVMMTAGSLGIGHAYFIYSAEKYECEKVVKP